MSTLSSETRAHLGTLYGQYCTDDTCWCQREPYLGVMGTKATLSSKNDLPKAARDLAILAIQSMRYSRDDEFRQAVDDVLSITDPRHAVETFAQPSDPNAETCAICDEEFIGHRYGALGHDWRPKPIPHAVKADELPRCGKCQGWHHPLTSCSSSGKDGGL